MKQLQEFTFCTNAKEEMGVRRKKKVNNLLQTTFKVNQKCETTAFKGQNLHKNVDSTSLFVR